MAQRGIADLIRKHPLLTWGPIVVTVLSLTGTVFWYLEDKRRSDAAWLVQDEAWNSTQIKRLEIIIRRQTEIQEELSAQTGYLQGIDLMQFHIGVLMERTRRLEDLLWELERERHR